MNDKQSILHEEVERLLPWFVNGTLDERSQRQVRSHLAQCPRCDAQYELACQEIRAIRAIEEPVAPLEPNLEKMLARIGPGNSRRYGPRRESGRRPFPSAGKWLPAACLAQMALLVALGMALFFKQPQTKQYEALASAETGKMKIAIVFRPDTTVQKMQDILRTAGANIVAGPTVTFAFVVEVAYKEGPGALRRFKMAPEVSLVQNLDQGGGS